MIEIYRLMWIIVMELWAVTEEKLQFYTDPEYKHDLSKEFVMYQLLKDIYTAKIDRVSKFDERKKSAFAFEQNFSKMTQGTDLLSKIQSKIREDTAAGSGSASP